MFFCNFKSPLKLSDSLENITSASKLRSDLRKALKLKRIQELEEQNKTSVDPPPISNTQEIDATLGADNSKTVDIQTGSKPSMHITCSNNCKLISVTGDDSSRDPLAGDKSHSLDLCYNVIAVGSRRSDMSTNLSQNDSEHGSQSTSSVCEPIIELKTVESRTHITSSNIDDGSNQVCYKRDVSESQIVGDPSKYSLDVIYNNPKAVSSRRDLRLGPKPRQTTLVDNRSKDIISSAVVSDGSNLRRNSTEDSQVGNGQNKCSINVSFSNLLVAKKHSDVRLPKRINCDITRPVARTNLEKRSFEGKVQTTTGGQGHTNQATRNNTSRPTGAVSAENRSKIQIPATMPLSWDVLAAQTYNMKSKDSSADLQGTIKQGTEKTDEKVVVNNSISLEQSTSQHSVRKRKRTFNEEILLVESKWLSMFNVTPCHLQSQNEFHIAASDKQCTPKQACWNIEELKDNVRQPNEHQLSSKDIDDGENKPDKQKQQIVIKLESTRSNDKGIGSKSECESTAISAESQRIRNIETMKLSQSFPIHNIKLTVRAPVNKDVNYSKTTGKTMLEAENSSNESNIHTREQQHYPPVREVNPFSIGITHNNVQANYPMPTSSGISNIQRQRPANYPEEMELKPNMNNKIDGKIQVDYSAVLRQNQSCKSSIHREKLTNYPVVWKQTASTNYIIHTEQPVSYPDTREQTPRSICSSNHREKQVDYPVICKQTPNSSNSINRDVQANYPGLREQTPSSIGSNHREKQVDYPVICKQTPKSNNSINRDVQANYPGLREQTPSSIGSNQRETQVDYPVICKQTPNSNNSIDRDVQANYPGIREQTPSCKISIQRFQVNYPVVCKQPSNTNNIINREVQLDYPGVRDGNPNSISFQKEKQLNHPEVLQQTPNTNNITRREVQLDYPDVGDEHPRCESSSNKERSMNYPAVCEPNPNIERKVQVNNSTESKAKANNLREETHVSHTVPKWQTMQESERYLNSCDYLDLKGGNTLGPTLDSSNHQQCQHCFSFKGESSNGNMITNNSNQVVDQILKNNVQEQLHKETQGHKVSIQVQSENIFTSMLGDKNKDIQQWIKKASIDFQNVSSECLLNSVDYNLISREDCKTELHEQPQTEWTTLKEPREHNNKLLNSTQHKSISDSKPICVEDEPSRAFQTELHQKLLQVKRKIPEKMSEYGKKDVLTPKFIADIEQMHKEEIPSRDFQSVVEMKLKTAEELSKNIKTSAEYINLLKPIPELHQAYRYVVEKPSRDVTSEVCKLSKTFENPDKFNEHGFQDRNRVVYQLDINTEITKTDTEDPGQWCFVHQRNQTLKPTSKSTNIYLDCEREALLSPDQSQTKPAYDSTICESDTVYTNNELKKLSEEVPSNKLISPAETDPLLEKWAYTMKTKRESEESATMKPVQQYRIKWMTRKENELREQVIAGKMPDIRSSVARKEQRRPETKKSKEPSCTMDATALETNGSRKYLQPKRSAGKSIWQDGDTRLEENVQEGPWSHQETHRECNKTESLRQYKEQSRGELASQYYTYTLRTDGDPFVGRKQVEKPTQESFTHAMKDASTYCNFKQTRKIVQQLQAEYGNFEALADRMKNITKKVLARVDTKTPINKGLDDKIKDLYDYCQKHHILPLNDVEHEGKIRNRSKFSKNVTTEHNNSKKVCHTLGEIDNENVLCDDKELEALLQIGVLGRGCCGLPHSLIHMHGVISNLTDDQDLQVLRLQYGDTHYMIEGDTVPNRDTKIRDGVSQTDALTPVAIASEDLWQKIEELYDYSKTLYSATTFPSNTSVNPDDAVSMVQSTESTDVSGSEPKDTSEESLTQPQLDRNAKDENMLSVESKNISTWRDNIFLDCNVVSENVLLACSDISGWNENIVQASDSKAQEYNCTSTRNENMLSERNLRNNSSTLGTDDRARNSFVSGPDGRHKQSNSPEGKHTHTLYRREQETTEPSPDGNNCFLLDSKKFKMEYRQRNPPESRTANSTAQCSYHSPLFSYSYPDTKIANKPQHIEDRMSRYETKNLYVNAELINNSTLNLILKFPSMLGIESDSGLSTDMDIEGHGELVHSSTERLPISVTLEHADLGKENTQMVTTIINVKNSPICQNDQLETRLDSESVNICLAMECTPHSEEDIQLDAPSNDSVPKHFFLLKPSEGMINNVPSRTQSYRLRNQMVPELESDVGCSTMPTGAYRLNVFVVRQPGIELHVKACSESSLM